MRGTRLEAVCCRVPIEFNGTCGRCSDARGRGQCLGLQCGWFNAHGYPSWRRSWRTLKSLLTGEKASTSAFASPHLPSDNRADGCLRQELAPNPRVMFDGGGCRGFVGPVPLPLLIRRAYSVVGEDYIRASDRPQQTSRPIHPIAPIAKFVPPWEDGAGGYPNICARTSAYVGPLLKRPLK